MITSVDNKKIIEVSKLNNKKYRTEYFLIEGEHLVEEALKLGFYISFAGPITFKSSKNAEEIVNMVPIDRLLIETDSPYLSPEPNRGKRNDSSNVKYIAKKIAEFRNVTINDIAKASYENANRLFNI